MKKRYFYNDSLQAAWMMKEFGFLIIEELAPKIVYSDYRELLDASSDRSWVIDQKYYIHPDNLHLIEPMVGDLLAMNGEPSIRYATFISQESDELFLADGEECLEGSREYMGYRWISKIIQRNGKAFHWPECEEIE